MHTESFTAEELEADALPAVCTFCRAKWVEQGKSPEAELLALKTAASELSASLTKKCDEAWDICLKCREVATIDDLPKCGARECSNFFPRMAAKVAAMRAMASLERFGRGVSGAA